MLKAVAPLLCVPNILTDKRVHEIVNYMVYNLYNAMSWVYVSYLDKPELNLVGYLFLQELRLVVCQRIRFDPNNKADYEIMIMKQSIYSWS